MCIFKITGMSITLKVIIFCFSICLTSTISASTSSDVQMDYLSSLYNNKRDQYEAINSGEKEISEEDPDEYLKNLVDTYSRSRIMQYGMNPVWLYSIPRPKENNKWSTIL